MGVETIQPARPPGWAQGAGARARAAWLPLALGAVLLAAAVIRLWGLDGKSLWFDEAYSVFIGREALTEIPRLLRVYDTHPPLHYVLLHLWMAVVGQSEVAVRLPSVLASLGAIGLTFLLARRLAGAQVGLLAAALLAASPFQVTAAQEARMYPFLLLFGLGASYALWRALEEGGRRYWIAYGLCLVLALYTHHFAFLLLLGQGVYVLAVHRERAASRSWLLAVAVVAVFLLPLLPLVWAQLGTARAYPAFRRPFAADALTHVMGLLSFGGGLLGMGTYYRPGTRPVAFQAALVLPFLLLASVGAAGVGRGKARGFLLTFWLVPVVAVTLIALRWDVFQERYFSFVLPPFSILLAAGVISLAHAVHGILRMAAVAVTIVVLLTANAVSLAGVYRDEPFYLWRAAARHVEAQAGADDFILYVPAFVGIPFDYYFRGSQERTDMRPLHVLPVARQAATGTLRLRKSVPSEQMAAIAQDHPRMWIISSLALGPGVRQRIGEALAPYFRQIDEAKFGLVSTSLWESRLFGARQRP